VLPPLPNGGSRSANPASGGPYRSSSVVAGEALEISCPYCGNRCSPMLRVCPHCDVRFDNVRCAGCYTLQPPGTFACARCGQALDLEPLLDPTDAPCPRCMTPLEAAGGAGAWEDARLHECPRCGGMFVPREALADILYRAELSGPFPDTPPGRVMALDEVKYLPCPLCHSSMNRINFGKLSGVIVDVCRSHGTWFDAGELTRVVAFVAGGGLAKTRAREEHEKKEHAKQAAAAQAQLASLQLRNNGDDRLEEWRFILRDLLFW
jgi:Zn-finger nucleic acid-binding protein